MHRIEELALATFDRPLKDLSDQEVYKVLLDFVQDQTQAQPLNQSKRKLYYISAEFLIGKLLTSNLLNLGCYDEVQAVLEANGQSLHDVEKAEKEPSLGNGGLGRLAACFLDSIASLEINGDGVGLNYHFGLFRQVFKDNQQASRPDAWLDQPTWLKPSTISYPVPFKDFTLKSTLYEIDVPGYQQASKNRLRLFDLDSVDEAIIEGESIHFDKEAIKKNLTLFLYPDDSDQAGELLRIYQQYFMVSNAAQLIIDESLAKGSNLKDLDEYAVVQINDTHPAFIIPEFIRLLTQNHDLSFEEALEAVTKTVAFTNHTILAEALEKWPMAYIEAVIPEIAAIIRQLDQVIQAKFPDQAAVQVIDADDRAHMAHIAIHFSKSVNGVAALHTDILKDSELHDFYLIYPDKFNNKTNGITFRRWLMAANPGLCDLFDDKLSNNWRLDHDFTGLLDYQDDLDTLEQIKQIKESNKEALKEFLYDNQGVTLHENAIIDVQIKRFHEYKRQQMLALYIIHKYLDIKAGNLPTSPITIIFGGKAAPAYIIAQDIIHLILNLSELIAKDPDVSPYLQVIMVENYNVTACEKLVTAADISEQISLASKEASGTGNMKFMLNGALTVCTLDGANVEIANLVGEDNIFIFGKSSQEIVDLYASGDYDAQAYYQRPAIQPLVDFIVGPEMMAIGQADRLERLHQDITTKDWFMALIDLEDFIQCKEEAYLAYQDSRSWYQKTLVNIAKAGYFSSDRTIQQYEEDIWHTRD
ncbi:glycogen/starch/alpha-glucan family phosphorylase [Hutsoniella sourekii]|uniref:glycogen/starch/alpha-glucan family phosphorylase n=1 Tax=Hutsoniella sourekii TaxID=87650 RepID=UPI000486303F|nr:glycogen/starch/alpha-glucan phosphorylase [Hutsoniella sourekii]